MLDFLEIDDMITKNGTVIFPKFMIEPDTEDLMIRGGDFYAVWDETIGMWSTNEKSVIKQVDAALRERRKAFGEAPVTVRLMRDGDSKSIDKWHNYVKHQMRDHFHPLDERIAFSNTDVKKSDYISKRLPYPLAKGDYNAWNIIISTLYDEENRRKIEWSIGAVGTGASKDIQKFFVFYGSAGSGKSTILNIIAMLFQGYTATLVAKEIGSSNGSFALEFIKSNPLVAIEHDSDLSRIEDNTRLNSLVSHESMEINAKYERKYSARSNAFLYMGTNRPVKITDRKSGLLRRLIDIRPSGKKIPFEDYIRLMDQVKFELGAIMWHCIEVYNKMGPSYYDGYVPIEMMSATNDFFDFMDYSYDDFLREDQVTLTEAWKRYKEYCEFANCYQLPMRTMREEMKNYFNNFEERAILDGVRVRNLYSGFLTSMFESHTGKEKKNNENGKEHSEVHSGSNVSVGNADRKPDDGNGGTEDGSGSGRGMLPGEEERRDWLELTSTESLFDRLYSDWPAQYEKDYGKGGQPEKAWAKCTTTLADLDTSQTHYVKPPADVPIVFVDFDMKGEDGQKDFKRNKEAASTWTPTYAELSKSGGGIHLYYLYPGNLNDLSRVYMPGIEIKVCTGNSAIRRKLTKCNDIPIATLTSGLPLKGERKKKVNWEGFKDEKHLHNHLVKEITKNLEKKVHADTTSSIDMIKKVLDEAYESGIPYDLENVMYGKQTIPNAVLIFAMHSTNQADRCIKTVSQMHFKHEIEEEQEVPVAELPEDPRPIVIDIEVYPPGEDEEKEPGFFLICWKYLGAPPDGIVAMVNPKAHEVEAILRYMMIGYNILGYDAYMLYSASMGSSTRELYQLSYNIINNGYQPPYAKQAKSMVLYDVYEYCKAAGDGKSLKKWEIELGYSHMEMDIPWDKPVPKEMWPEVIEYCKNDVLATELVYNKTKGYRMARDFQVNLVKALHGDDIPVVPADTANTLTKRAIFGMDRHPQSEFNYRDLALPVGSDQYNEYLVKFGSDYKFRVWNADGLPEYRDYIPGEVLPDGWSILPFFPGYKFDRYAKKGFQSFFHDDYGGEGGRTFSLPGMYVNVWDGDIASQYPHSIMAEMLFGPRYTKIFAEIVKARIAVKHHDFETASGLLGGALQAFLSDDTAKDLAQGMKIIINAVYGLTKAGFDNEFRDPRNVDNIVAKRGNLFMLVLKEQIEARGYSVVHIKTDSIKIANATQEIKDFVVEFGREYGYEFETEGEFEKFVLLNDAAYVAYDKKEGWITKAAQFQEPYVKKTLFTKEAIKFDDLCQTFSVHSGSLYLDRNEKLENVDDQLEATQKTFDRLHKKLLKTVSEALPGADIEEQVEYMEQATDPKVKTILDQLNPIADKLEHLKQSQASGHNMIFVGRVGRFCPVVSGSDGGILYRVQDNKNYAVGGTSGYRWLEAEYIQKYGKEDCIDISYYNTLVDKAADAIKEYGDLEWFLNGHVTDEDFINVPTGEDREVVIASS